MKTRPRLGFAGMSVALVAGGAVMGLALAQAPPTLSQGVNEPTIRLADAPAAVRAAVSKFTTERNVQRVVREVGSSGAATFEVVFNDNGRLSEAEVAESGELMELATGIDAKSLPPAVADALAQAYPGAAIQEAFAKQVSMYEVVITDAAGQGREVIIMANGQVGGEGDDDDDEDDDDDDDDDDDESEEDDDEDDDEGEDDQSEEGEDQG